MSSGYREIGRLDAIDGSAIVVGTDGDRRLLGFASPGRQMAVVDLGAEAWDALAGVGDASLGEWREHNGRFFHLRRRLSEAEQRQVGPALDIRRTPEALRRGLSLGSMLRYAPPEVLADELGEP